MIKRKGSVTIEASYLLPIILIVIIMLVYSLFFCYNKIVLWKNTYYAGLKLVEQERDGRAYDLEKEWQILCKDTLILPENIKVNKKQSITSITVLGEIEFTIPFWGTVKLEEKSVVPLCNGKEIVVRGIVWR